jgi:hypothetical protein
MDNDPQPALVREVARALATLKAPGARIDFVRMLRSNSPAKRALGAECLALRDDRESAVDLSRLLDDYEPIVRRAGDAEETDRGRVCDAAATAIGRLLSQPLPASRPERLKAARACVSPERQNPK